MQPQGVPSRGNFNHYFWPLVLSCRHIAYDDLKTYAAPLFRPIFHGARLLPCSHHPVIWCRETEGAPVSSFFREIFAPLLQCRGPKTGGSITVLFYLGIPQFFFWLVSTVRPDFAQNMFHLDSFQGYSAGFLASYFFLMSIAGEYHVVGACNVNHCLNLAFVFYRIFFNVPVYIVLFLVDQIERNLFIVLMVFYLTFPAVIFISLVRERSTKDEKSSEEQSILNAE